MDIYSDHFSDGRGQGKEFFPYVHCKNAFVVTVHVQWAATTETRLNIYDVFSRISKRIGSFGNYGEATGPTHYQVTHM